MKPTFKPTPGKYSEVTGDIDDYIKNYKPGDVFCHVTNCFNALKSGVAVVFKKYGGEKVYFELDSEKGNFLKMGNIQWWYARDLAPAGYGPGIMSEFSAPYTDPDNEKDAEHLRSCVLVNMYAQYYHKRNNPEGPKAKNLDYDALKLCLQKVNFKFKGRRIILPRIGGGRAGGYWPYIKKLIQTHLKDCEVLVVEYNKEDYFL